LSAVADLFAKLTLRDGRFTWPGDAATAKMAQGAGFAWSQAEKLYWTTSALRASSLEGFASSEARDAIAEDRLARSGAIEASRATFADIDVAVPDGLELLGYQRAGIAYMAARPASLLADEPGLGKTVQVVGLANYVGARNILVVCPLSVKLNWAREISKWSVAQPGLSTGFATAKAWPEATDVVIGHYDIIANYVTQLRSRPWDLVVLDEAHYLKNPDAKRSRAIFGDNATVEPVAACRRLVLTGTPVPNRPVEIYGLLAWLAPEVAGGWVSFVRAYCAGKQSTYGWDVSGASNLAGLQDLLRSTVMVRRCKDDVLAELPPKRRQVISLSPADIAGVRAALDAERAYVFDHAGGPLHDDEYLASIERLVRRDRPVELSEMSQLRHATALAKAPAVAAHVADMLDGGVGKVVCWAHHHDVASVLAEALGRYGVLTCTGATPAKVRQANVDAFNAPGGERVLVGGISALGTGVTLTASSHVVFAELDWAPANMTQAEDRCHRIGQASTVLVQHVVLDGSLDDVLARVLASKQAIADKALDRVPSMAAVAKPPAIAVAAEPAQASYLEAIGARCGPEALALVRQGIAALAQSEVVYLNDLDRRIVAELGTRASLSVRQAALGALVCSRYGEALGDLTGALADLTRR